MHFGAPGFNPPGFVFNITGAFTFPSNGDPSFNTCVAASVSSFVSGFGASDSGDQPFNLTLPSGGTFCSTWVLEPNFDTGVGNVYIFDGGQFVSTPEPAPLLLVGTGLLAFPFLRRFVS